MCLTTLVMAAISFSRANFSQKAIDMVRMIKLMTTVTRADTVDTLTDASLKQMSLMSLVCSDSTHLLYFRLLCLVVVCWGCQSTSLSFPGVTHVTSTSVIRGEVEEGISKSSVLCWFCYGLFLRYWHWLLEQYLFGPSSLFAGSRQWSLKLE